MTYDWDIDVGDTVMDEKGRQGEVVSLLPRGIEICFDEECIEYEFDDPIILTLVARGGAAA